VSQERPVRRCSIPQRDRDFPTLQSDLAGDLAHQTSYQAVKGGLFPELKSPGLQYEQTSLFSVHTENDWSYTSAAPSALTA
jgi:hypothetical protein